MVASVTEVHEAIVNELRREDTKPDRFSFLFALEATRHCLPQDRLGVIDSMITHRICLEHPDPMEKPTVLRHTRKELIEIARRIRVLES